MHDVLLSTAEAADRLGVSRRQVQLWIDSERLPAQRVGRSWVVRESDVDSFVRRPVGRPPKGPE